VALVCAPRGMSHPPLAYSNPCIVPGLEAFPPRCDVACHGEHVFPVAPVCAPRAVSHPPFAYTNPCIVPGLEAFPPRCDVARHGETFLSTQSLSVRCFSRPAACGCSSHSGTSRGHPWRSRRIRSKKLRRCSRLVAALPSVATPDLGASGSNRLRRAVRNGASVRRLLHAHDAGRSDALHWGASCPTRLRRSSLLGAAVRRAYDMPSTRASWALRPIEAPAALTRLRRSSLLGAAVCRLHAHAAGRSAAPR
jgi:hypothetical protein